MSRKWFTANRMTFTFVLLGLLIFLFIVVPLIRMIAASNPDILFDTLLDPQVRDAIWLTLYRKDRECPECGADKEAWEESFGEKHNCN